MVVVNGCGGQEIGGTDRTELVGLFGVVGEVDEGDGLPTHHRSDLLFNVLIHLPVLLRCETDDPYAESGRR